MNARQAAKKAAEHIERLEDYNRRASADIKAYNLCIDSMIAGGSPCDWCQEQEECKSEAKESGKGCSGWWLMDNPPVGKAPEGGEANESKGILSASSES